MSKYLKWELINEFKSKIVLFGIVALVFLLVLVLPDPDNVLMFFLYLAFFIILFGSFALSFIYGAKRTMDSYKNQTFLLESMIPLSPSKLLLCKYLLAIIFDFLFSVIFVLGLSVLLSKADVNLIKELISLFLDMDFDSKKVLMKVFLLTISSTIAFTSLISLFFIGLKSFFPGGKALKLISYILGVFILNVFYYKLVDTFSLDTNSYLAYTIVMLGVTCLCYLGSVWFIENKLEVYG